MNTTELRGPRYAELSSLYLKSRGIASARTRPRAKLSELVLDDALSTADVLNVGPFYIATKASYSMAHLSDSLDRAEDRARTEGHRFPVVIWFRKERSVGEHYAVLPLSALADLMATFEMPEVA